MKQRFEREAQTIGGINHPHICVLHDVDHQDDTDYPVMEYAEAPSSVRVVPVQCVKFSA